MSRFGIKHYSFLVICLALAVPPQALAQDRAATLPGAAQARVAVDDFFQYANFSDAVLSPNGRHIALRLSNKDTPMMLVVIPVDTQIPKVAMRSSSDVEQFRWVSDTRLVFTLTDRAVAVGNMDRGPGLYAVNIDGSGGRQLASRRDSFVTDGSKDKLLSPYTTLVTSVGKQDSDTIFVNTVDLDQRYGNVLNLVELNTRTGYSDTVTRPGHTVHWVLDQNAQPRIAVTTDKGRDSVQYKDPATGQWRALFEYNANGNADRIEPVLFGPDGTLYVRTHAGRDKAALFAYDVKRKQMAATPIVSLDAYGFQGALVFRNDKLVGAHYLADAPSTTWLDPDMKALQERVDAKLPATNNRLSFGRRSETPYMLVHASSDVEPGSTYLFNTETGALVLLGRAQRQIKSADMATMDTVRYKARDGLDIPAYLTLPKNGPQTGLPLVVFVHGGPWVRGEYWRWNPEVQFLASRGYAVLEPEYRGSAGYGLRHLQAGFRQWGLHMQDDLADAAKWAIASGVADPKRICIAGASYGGYAALMGVLNDPQLFRCAIDWAGVTDINLMYDAFWSDFSDVYKTYGMPALIGDQKRDAAQLKATSPLEQAARITQPLLLAYGSADRRVPIEHGKKFRDAVTPGNRNVEWVEYDGEGHGWGLLKTRIDFWSRVEKFLDRNIGSGAAK